jgi:hypothetical protein
LIIQEEENSVISKKQSELILETKSKENEEEKSEESLKEETDGSCSPEEEDDNYLESLLERRKIDSLRKSFGTIKKSEIPAKYSQNQISYIPGTFLRKLINKRNTTFSS